MLPSRNPETSLKPAVTKLDTGDWKWGCSCGKVAVWKCFLYALDDAVSHSETHKVQRVLDYFTWCQKASRELYDMYCDGSDIDEETFRLSDQMYEQFIKLLEKIM